MVKLLDKNPVILPVQIWDKSHGENPEDASSGFFWPFEKNSRRKNSKLKKKTKTQAENSNFRHFWKKKLYFL